MPSDQPGPSPFEERWKDEEGRSVLPGSVEGHEIVTIVVPTPIAPAPSIETETDGNLQLTVSTDLVDSEEQED